MIFAKSFIEVETEKIWSKLEHEREGLVGSEVVVGVVLLLKAIERLLEKTEFWPGLSRQAKIKEGGPRF